MTKQTKGLTMVCLGASMWGGSGVAGQYLLQDCGFSTAWLVVSRMLLAGCMFLLIDFAQYRQNVFTIWKNKRDARDVLLFAIFGMLAVQYTYFACIRQGNAAAATILQYLMPVIIIGYSSLATHKFPPGRELLCVVMAIGGTFLLVTHGRLDTLSIPLAALLWGLGSAFAAAFYTTQPKRLIRKWRATLITGWGMLLGGLALMPVCPPWQFSGTWSSAAAITYAYIIIFGTVIAFGCYLGSIKYISPTETSLLGSIEPLSAIVFSILFLHASFAPMDYLGTALILGTVFVLAKK
ncbi:EamA family transporter [Selenomonas sp.]|uniref:DMT family transporter n=1 Tax=Selenomonas sp. TaxID=2053611 RepID=UPI0025E39F6B|nr:EamA family transporter [Selenomonas sp.]